jgi:hypothetical protein
MSDGLVMRSSLLLAFVLALAACSAPPRAPDAAALASYKQSWGDLELSQAHGWTEEGYHREVTLIRSPLFATLSIAQQRDRLREASVFALKYRDFCTGHELARRASEMTEANSVDWGIRAQTAYLCGDRLDAMRAMTATARRSLVHPVSINALLLDMIARYPLHSPVEREAHFELLESLYQAQWTRYAVPEYELWGELAADLFEKGQVNRALEIARQVNSPRFVLWMRVDKRFDSLVSQDPEAFDIDRAAARAMNAWTDATNRYPRQLHPIVELTAVLLDVGRNEDALKISGTVLLRVPDAQGFKRVFDDDETDMNWILDEHSRALRGLQRWKEAEWELRAAADREEHNGRNVTEIINLAGFEAELGRADEALKTIADLPEDAVEMSPFGRMQFYGVRLAAAAEMRDAALEKRCLTYMEAHQIDAPSTYQASLVRAGRSDEAAKLLIRRLNDPHTRHEALMDVQRYSNRPMPPEEQRLHERWREIVQRSDVQKAVASVGRIVDVALPGGL